MQLEEKEIVEKVLLDMRREDDDVIAYLENKPTYDQMCGIDKLELYCCLQKEKPDAERRINALNSYKQYPLLKDEQYVVGEDKYIYYDNRIKITADLLTGYKEIVARGKQLRMGCNTNENGYFDEIMNAFYEVVFTSGNCCPIMKNKGGRKGDIGGIETCWYKLATYVDLKKYYAGITQRQKEIDNNLLKRKAEDMFAVFPYEMKGEEIIQELFFQDYYNEERKIVETRRPNDICDIMEYGEYVAKCTKLIVQRGLRIAMGYQEKKFSDEQKIILKKIFKQIGLPLDKNGEFTIVE